MTTRNFVKMALLLTALSSTLFASAAVAQDPDPEEAAVIVMRALEPCVYVSGDTPPEVTPNPGCLP